MTSAPTKAPMSLKRSGTIRPGDPSERRLKLARSDTFVLKEPPAVRRPQLDCHIVVVSQLFPIEAKLNEKNGYLRGLGNTFTLEVISEGCEDAVTCVEKMLGIDFDTNETIAIVRVEKAPKVDWTGSDGRNATVISSRRLACDGKTPYEELVNAAKAGDSLRARDDPRGEGLQRKVLTAMAEAERETGATDDYTLEWEEERCRQELKEAGRE